MNTAKKISPLVFRCIFRFVAMYEKVEENMSDIIPFNEEVKETLLKGIGEI